MYLLPFLCSLSICSIRQDLAALSNFSLFLNSLHFQGSEALLIFTNSSSSSFFLLSSPQTVAALAVTLTPAQASDLYYVPNSFLPKAGLMSRGMSQFFPTPPPSLLPPNCLRVSGEVFATSHSTPAIGSIDEYLISSQNMIFDHYKSPHNDFMRLKFLKNRHLMVVKVLVSNLNLSLDACSIFQFPGGKFPTFALRDLDFGISSYTQQIEKKFENELIWSREDFVVKFASVWERNYAELLVRLLRPIGWTLGLVTLGLWGLLGLVVWLYLRKGKFSDVVGLFVRASVDQCVEGKVLGRLFGRKDELRLIYMGWLLYSLLLVASYRGNLVNVLSEPVGRVGKLENWEQLARDRGRRLIGIGRGGRPGQNSNVRLILQAEAERNPTFASLYSHYEKQYDINPKDIFLKKVNLLDDAVILERLFSMLDKSYNVPYYKLSPVALRNKEYWAIKNGPNGPKIRQTINQLIDAGIVDLFSRQQELIEAEASRRVVKLFFDAALYEEDEDDEEDDEEEEASKKDTLIERGSKLYQKIAIENDLGKFGPQPLKTENLFVLAWLWMGGALGGVVGFGLEVFVKVGIFLSEDE